MGWKVIDDAREATAQLRDFAREHGMHFRQRDPLVTAIHGALDKLEAALEGKSPAAREPRSSDSDSRVNDGEIQSD